MVKKKVSGQTIAIIILAMLLLVSIVFGGVYAYYSARSSKVYGNIVMANLKINLTSKLEDGDQTGETGSSEIMISNNTDVVPGQPLTNTPLTIENLSSVPIYLVVVYQIEANAAIWDDEKNNFVYDEKGNEVKEPVKDEFKNAVMGITFTYEEESDGQIQTIKEQVEYVNPLFPDRNSTKNPTRTEWIDFVYKAHDDDDNAKDVTLSTGETCKAYRCLVSKVSFARTTNEPIVVIPRNGLSLSGAMGNEFQRSTITFTLQAYAIAAATDFGFVENETREGRCNKIIDLIYESQEFTFLKSYN